MSAGSHEPSRALLDTVDADGNDQDHAGHDLLPEARDALDRKPVLERPDEQHTDGRAGHSADAAQEAGSSEEHGRGGGERDLGPHIGARRSEPTGLHHACERGAGADDPVYGDERGRGVDARETRCFDVPADRIDVPAEVRPAEDRQTRPGRRRA